jgi:hypothetical protein
MLLFDRTPQSYNNEPRNASIRSKHSAFCVKQHHPTNAKCKLKKKNPVETGFVSKLTIA